MLVLFPKIDYFSSLSIARNCNFSMMKLYLQKELGTFPMKLFPAKFKTIRFCQCTKQLGSCPENMLSERSRYLNNPSLILQTNEIEPENRFLARFNIVRLAGKIGSGPSKRLSLRSIPKAVRPFFDMDTSGKPTIYLAARKT
jgi:hypothetical protein